MLKFHADRWMRLSSSLSYLYATLKTYEIDKGNPSLVDIPGQVRQYLTQEVIPALSDLKMKFTMKKANHILESATRDDIQTEISELEERLHDRAQCRHFWAVVTGA